MKGIMKRISVFFLCTFVVMGMTLGMAIPSYAATDVLSDVVRKLETYENSNDSAKKEVYEEAVDTWQDIEDSSSSSEAFVNITFAGTTKKFINTTTDMSAEKYDENYGEAYKTMKSYLTKAGEVDTDVKTVSGVKTQLDSMVDGMNIQADITGGSNSLASITPLISTITGVIVVVVLLGMALFTSFDVAYLVFPVAKQKMDSAGSSGGNKMASRTDAKTGEARFRWVTDDAINAYTQATETGKNPLFTYMRNRLWSYIAVAIVIFILMSGNLAVIINFILQMLSSVFDMFGRLSTGA